MCGAMLFSSDVPFQGFYPFCSDFRVRVSAAPFAGQNSGGAPAARASVAELGGASSLTSLRPTGGYRQLDPFGQKRAKRRKAIPCGVRIT